MYTRTNVNRNLPSAFKLARSIQNRGRSSKETEKSLFKQRNKITSYTTLISGPLGKVQIISKGS